MEGESVKPLKTPECGKDGCSRSPCFSGNPPESLCLLNSGLEDRREDLNKWPLSYTLHFRDHSLSFFLLYYLLPSAFNRVQSFLSWKASPLLSSSDPHSSASWMNLLKNLPFLSPHFSIYCTLALVLISFPRCSLGLSITSALIVQQPFLILYRLGVSKAFYPILYFPHLETLYPGFPW